MANKEAPADRKQPSKQLSRGMHPSQGIYVVQKRAAREMHYDLKLEFGSTIKSWAVPQGPSLDPAEKRLAVHVEDQTAAEAELGSVTAAGANAVQSIIVWDRGTWQAEGETAKGYEKGHLRFFLEGPKLQGGWDLIRMAPRRKDRQSGKENWLLVKLPDAYARSERAHPVAKGDSTSANAPRIGAAQSALSDA